MTYLDKYIQEHPGENVISDAYGIGCPYHYNYEKNYDCSGVICHDCWNREMPEESESLKAVEIGEAVREGFDAGMAAAKTYSHEEVKMMLDIADDVVERFNEATGENGPKIHINPEWIAEVNSIKDSGDRTQFATGAVRDMHEGKGRCDLLPLDALSFMYDHLIGEGEASYIFWLLSEFQNTGLGIHLICVLDKFHGFDDSLETMFLEVAKHFEDGAKKYGEYNWQKGIPVNCYIDSAVRHYLKYLRGDEDERHDRAFVWNILCCIWTCKHKPELNCYLKKEERS